MFYCSASTCDFVTKHKCSLTRHMLGHSDKKPLSCHLCDKSFQKQIHLNSHVMSHTRIKPYPCLYKGCEYSCNSQCDLNRHVRHHTGEKPYKCYFVPCGYAATTPSDLKKHIYTHTGERPFRCSFKNCEYACTASCDLTKHIRTHSGSKPYPCNFNSCQHSFTMGSVLRVHVLGHLVKNPHKCPQCHFQFETLLEVEQHFEHSHKPQEKLVPGNDNPNFLSVRIVDTSQVEPDDTVKISTKKRDHEKSRVSQVSLKSNGVYLCVICDFRIKTLKKFKGHLQYHWEEGTKTEESARIIPNDTGPNHESKISIKGLKKHKKHACMFKGCNFASMKLKKYKLHLDWHLETEQFFCSLCDFVCIKRKRFKAHRRVHAGASSPG